MLCIVSKTLQYSQRDWGDFCSVKVEHRVIVDILIIPSSSPNFFDVVASCACCPKDMLSISTIPPEVEPFDDGGDRLTSLYRLPPHLKLPRPPLHFLFWLSKVNPPSFDSVSWCRDHLQHQSQFQGLPSRSSTHNSRLILGEPSTTLQSPRMHL